MGAIQKAFTENEGWDTGMARLYELLSQDFLYSDPSKLITFADNHDIERMYPVLKTVDNLKMALAFIATTRGFPMIYYGTEALSDRGTLQGDPGKRKDFPGGWQGDTTNMFSRENLNNDQKDILDFTTTLFTWRKGNKAVQNGKLTHYIPEDGIYVYFRTLDNSAVMVIINNNEKYVKTLSTARFNENLKRFKTGKDIFSGNQIKDLSTIELPAKSVKIIELSK
jgi:glycosidase